MTPSGRVSTLTLVATTVLCVALLWLAGFGFGHELAIARWLRRPFLGSTVYFGTWLMFLMMFLIGLGVPLLVIRSVWHEDPQSYGFSFANAERGVKWVLALTPVWLLASLGSASIGTDRYYTYLREPGFVTPVYIAIHSVSYGMYAFGFESLFRGFLLFGLERRLGESRTGRWGAALLSAGLSAASLIGLPWVFPASALLGGVPMGLLSLRLRSFVYAALVHWNVGIWSDVWEIIKLNVSNRI